MKLSNYRGEDVRKILLKAAVLIAAVLGIALLGIVIGHKFVGKKVSSAIKEMKEKREEDEKQEKINDKPEKDFEDQNAETGKVSEEQTQTAAETETETEEESAIHRYDYIVEDCTWKEALQKCRERGGSLASIESREEYDFIVAELENGGMGEILFYLGACRDAENRYYWLDAEGVFIGAPLNGNAENWSYEAWMRGEPSFYDGDIEENVLALFYFKDEMRWVFNDVPEDILGHLPYYSGKIGYICEYE